MFNSRIEVFATLSIRVIFSIDPFSSVFTRLEPARERFECCLFLPTNGKRSDGREDGGGGGDIVKVNEKQASATATSGWKEAVKGTRGQH